MNAQQAKDIMCGIVLQNWNPAHEIIWPDQADATPSADAPWARVFIRHATGSQRSLGPIGGRRFENKGVMIIQVMTPAGTGSSGSSIAEALVNGFRDAQTDVWFRNTRMREVGASGAFNQINVLTDFTYDEVR